GAGQLHFRGPARERLKTRVNFSFETASYPMAAPFGRGESARSTCPNAAGSRVWSHAGVDCISTDNMCDTRAMCGKSERGESGGNGGILSLLRPYTGKLLGVVALLGMLALANMALPFTIKLMIDNVFPSEANSAGN